MSACSKCGGEIEFRRIDGRTTPIRVTCSCGGETATSQPSECYGTACPKCSQQVFFVRHNGGSVWLDELSPPWPRHGCFTPEPTYTKFLEGFQIPEGTKGLILGILTYIHYRCSTGVTILEFHIGKKRSLEQFFLAFSGDGRSHLPGKINSISPISIDRKRLYLPDGTHIKFDDRWLSCRHCGTPYPFEKLAAHQAGHQ